jgi:hypothetical protein
VSTEQHDADAYGQELARISRHPARGRGDAVHGLPSRRTTSCRSGRPGWWPGPPHGSEQRFEDGWFAGVHEVAGYLLRIADTTATAQRWRAASSGMLLAHLQQSYSPVPEESHRPWRWT